MQSKTTPNRFEVAELQKLLQYEVPKELQYAFIEQAEAYELGKYDIEFFAKYWLGIDLNEFQSRVLRDTFGRPNNLIVAGNRSGKTVLIAILHIWHGFYKFGLAVDYHTADTRTYNTFNISPVSRQAKQVGKYVEKIVTGNFAWEKDGKFYSNVATEDGRGIKIKNFFLSKNENLGEMKFSNGWVFYSVSTHQNESVAIQGLPAGYISYDECIESKRLESDIMGQVSRLGDYGVRHDLVTAFHPTELFNSSQYVFHMYVESKRLQDQGKVGDWYLSTGTYDENDFISEEQKIKHKARVRATAGEQYDAIISGMPTTGKTKMYDMEIVEHIWNGFQTPTLPQKEHKYLISVDWGLSDGGDETVFLIFDYTPLPWQIVNAISVQGGDPWVLMSKLRDLQREYNDADVVMDTNSLGGVVFKKMLADIRPKKFDSHGTEKADALSNLKLVLTFGRKRDTINGEIVDKNPDYGLIRSYYLPKLGEQLAQYQLKDDKLQTDWVSALYQGAHILWKRYKNQLQGKRQNYSLTMS